MRIAGEEGGHTFLSGTSHVELALSMVNGSPLRPCKKALWVSKSLGGKRCKLHILGRQGCEYSPN